MNCCKKSIGLLIIRLGFGSLLLMGGITKLMTPGMADFVGGAAHTLGLTFLSTTVWFWLAAVGETLAGILLIGGLLLPLASLLTVIIMLVAFFGAHNADMQAGGMPAITFIIAALGLGFAGPGKYSIQSLLCKSCVKKQGDVTPVAPTTPVVAPSETPVV